MIQDRLRRLLVVIVVVLLLDRSKTAEAEPEPPPPFPKGPPPPLCSVPLASSLAAFGFKQVLMGKRRTFRRKTVMVKLSAYLGLQAPGALGEREKEL